MPSVFSIIADVWGFQRRQSVLTHILFWFIILPQSGTNIVMRFLSSSSMMFGQLSPSTIVAWLGILFFQLILLWGLACVILVGKRVLVSSAGRNRTSFRAVRNQAIPFIIPLFLTGILRTCFTFLWSLLFIIPGIIYQIRTTFYAVITVCDRTSYRPALIKSKEVVRGQTWRVFKYIVGLSLLTFAPAYLTTALITAMIHAFDDRFLPVIDVVDGTFHGIALLFFNLSLVILYRDLQRHPHLISPPPIEGTS